MEKKNADGNPRGSKRIPLWKWILIIVLVVALPLFFSFARNNQMQRALINSEPESQTNQQVENQNGKVTTH